jgi:hypothetical protein
MAKYARIIDGVAVDVVTGSPNGRYHPSLVSQFQTVPNGVVEGSRLVSGSWQPPAVVEQPQAPPAPALSLSHIAFVRHAREVGGLTPEGYLEAKANPLLAFFWEMFGLATVIERDDPDVREGADAWQALGYITEQGKTAIFDQWPTA